MRAIPFSPREAISKIPKIPHWLFSTLPDEWRTQGPDKVLTHYLARVGIPDYATRRVLLMSKRMTPTYLRRRAKVQSAMEIPKETGWLKAGRIADVEKLVSRCDAIYRRKENWLQENWQPPFSLLIEFANRTVLNPDDLKPIVSFCAQPAIFDIVANYMGQYPVLSNVSLGYTGVNTGRISSQQFHRDMNDPDQIHMVVPIHAIADDNGPFTFLPANESRKVVKALHHTGGRIADDDVFSVSSRDKLVKIVGEPGTIYFVNPYSCIHYGARSHKRPRLILIVNFTTILSGQGPTSVCRCSNRRLLTDGSKNANLLLDL